MTAVDTTQAGGFSVGASARPQPGAPSVQSAPAGTSGQSDPTSKGTGRQAWLREMERAQASGWFQPFNEASVASDSGRPSEAMVPRALNATRPPMAFAPLMQREARIEGAAEKSPEPQQSSLQADAAPEATSAANQPDAVGTKGRGGESSKAASSASTSPIEEIVVEPGAEIQDAVALRNGSGSALMPQGALGFRAAALQGDASRAADANGPLKRLPVAPIVPASSQAAALQTAVHSLPSSQDMATADATAVACQRSDEVDESLSGSNMVRAALSDQAATRLHSTWTEDGLNLWLGMDGSAQQVSAQASMIVSTLQQTLRSHGQRLNRVVCNGSVVFDASASSVSNFRDFSAELEHHASAWPSVESRSFLSQKETS